MPTLAPLPWHVRTSKDGSASIRDANADVLGVFTSFREAEYLLSFFDQVEKLEEDIEEVNTEIEDLDNKIAASDLNTTKLENEIKHLEFQLANTPSSV